MRTTNDFPKTLRTLGLALTLATASALALACGPEEELATEDMRSMMFDVEAAEPASSVKPMSDDPVGADELDDPIEGCTLEARPAALITVLDDRGELLSGDELDGVWWRNWQSEDEGWSEPLEALCIDEECTHYAIGHATPGSYLVGAFGCEDYTLERFEVELTEDGCHVDTLDVRLTLDATSPACIVEDDELAPNTASCEDDTRTNPAVIALTGVQQGDMILPWQPKLITARHESESAPSQMNCLDEECTQWADGWNQAGEFELEAQLCGQEVTRTVDVDAAEDGCGVETEWVGMYVDAPQCTTTTMNYDYEELDPEIP